MLKLTRVCVNCNGYEEGYPSTEPDEDGGLVPTEEVAAVVTELVQALAPLANLDVSDLEERGAPGNTPVYGRNRTLLHLSDVRLAKVRYKQATSLLETLR